MALTSRSTMTLLSATSARKSLPTLLQRSSTTLSSSSRSSVVLSSSSTSLSARTLFGSAKNKAAAPSDVSAGAAAGAQGIASVNNSNNAGGSNGGGPKRSRGILKMLRRGVYTTIGASLIAFSYYVYVANNPPDQLPQDPSKKTIVVLGSGWAATSMLTHIDTKNYNVIVISPADYFLFTPLLPSVTVGTINGRSIAQPTRQLTRFFDREVQVLEAEATRVDAEAKTVTFEDKSEIRGALGTVTIPFDYLVYAVGSAPQTFGIDGVAKYGCFLKELKDAEKIRNRLMDCVESACITGQSPEEVERLLTIVTCGGGPTGVEFAAELRDFVRDDLSVWYPEIANKVKVILIEGLDRILPMFSARLTQYTEHEFETQGITVLTKHMLKDVDSTHVSVQRPDGSMTKIPFGTFVMAAGNGQRPITRDLMAQLPSTQKNRRGLEVDDHMRLKGCEDYIFALGDCTVTKAAATAQAASQQGKWLGKRFNQMARIEELTGQLEEAQAVAGRTTSTADEENVKQLEKMLTKAQRLKPFSYLHTGALAYIGHDKAIADLPWSLGEINVGGSLVYLGWRSVYFTKLFSLRNRFQVAADWTKVKLFGRDVSRE